MVASAVGSYGIRFQRLGQLVVGIVDALGHLSRMTHLGNGTLDSAWPVSAEVVVRPATMAKDVPTGTFCEDDGELRW